MEIVYHSVAILLIILGAIGCVAPILPGPILSYCALFCMIPTDKCPSLTVFIVLGLLTLIVTVADTIIPVIGAKKFNCTKSGTWGCVIGTIVGLFFLPIGLIAGPFLGAFIGELIETRKFSSAMRGGIGALVGFLAGTFLKLIVCALIAAAFIWQFF